MDDALKQTLNQLFVVGLLFGLGALLVDVHRTKMLTTELRIRYGLLHSPAGSIRHR